MIKILDFNTIQQEIEGVFKGEVIKAIFYDSELNIKFPKYFLTKDSFKKYLIKRKVDIGK